MKEINDNNINLDALFEGKPFDSLDAATQAYVLIEFGSREEYEAMSSSFKRIRSVINEEEEITADDGVKKELMALFNKEEDRKVVPLVPTKTGGMGLLRSPYFQMAVAASLVLVALYFVPWNSKQNDQLALNNKTEKTAIERESELSTGKEAAPDSFVRAGEKTIASADGKPGTKKSGVNGPADELVEGEERSEEVPMSVSEDANGQDVDDRRDAYFSSIPAEELKQEKDKKEEGKLSKEDSKSIAVTPNRNNVYNLDSEENKRKMKNTTTSKDADSKNKKMEDANLDDEVSGYSKGEVNAGLVMPAAVNAAKKAIAGISLADKKDLMQFFNTAL